MAGNICLPRGNYTAYDLLGLICESKITNIKFLLKTEDLPGISKNSYDLGK